MSTVQPYLSPARRVRHRFSVQGSRFIATLTSANTEAAAKKIIESVSMEFPDASHHTYAYRIGSGSALIERVQDDREPAGTAGAPMLQVLQGKNVSDAVIIGTRYFGGTRLGIGGLKRAYRDCARITLKDEDLRTVEVLDSYSLKLAYEDLGSVTRLIKSSSGKITGIDYSEMVVIRIQIPARLSPALLEGLESVSSGRVAAVKLWFC
ncbi:MAG: IMPACT family protein [Bacillota bacterium]